MTGLSVVAFLAFQDQKELPKTPIPAAARPLGAIIYLPAEEGLASKRKHIVANYP